MKLAKLPFRDLYSTLRMPSFLIYMTSFLDTFCRRLQLDILHSQLSQKDKKNVQVPIYKVEYDPTEENLNVYYWKYAIDCSIASHS